MKKPEQISDELLLDYIDDQVDKKTRMMVEVACTNPAFKARLAELQQINQLLSQERLVQPSKNFSQKVMMHLGEPQETAHVKRNGFILLVLALLTVVLGTVYMTEMSVTFDFDTMNTTIFDRLLHGSAYKIPDTIHLKWLTEGLLFMLLVTSLLLLDRMILRPFFRTGHY